MSLGISLFQARKRSGLSQEAAAVNRLAAAEAIAVWPRRHDSLSMPRASPVWRSPPWGHLQ